MRYLVYILVSFVSVSTFAASKGSDKVMPQLRLFGGVGTMNPKDVTVYTDAQNIEKLDSAILYGVEADQPILGGISFGLRYQVEEESLGTKGAAYYTKRLGYKQELIFAMLRIPMVAESIFRFDVFGGGGLATAKFDSPSGTLTNKFDGSTLGTMAGASVSVGFWDVFLTVEAGQEFIKYKDLKASDKDSTALFGSADMSGTFVTFGLLFNGMPKWAKGK